MKRALKALLLQWMPTTGHRWLRARKQASRSYDHRDPVFLTLTPQVVFETYWKDVEAGRGPALIVWFDYRKILKFDCFGKGRGHYHVALPARRQRSREFDRIHLPEETIATQLERVAFELQMNLRYYLRHCPYRSARKATVPQEDLLRVVRQACALMHKYRVSEFPTA